MVNSITMLRINKKTCDTIAPNVQEPKKKTNT